MLLKEEILIEFMKELPEEERAFLRREEERLVGKVFEIPINGELCRGKLTYADELFHQYIMYLNAVGSKRYDKKFLVYLLESRQRPLSDHEMDCLFPLADWV
jgi:hypothetical protein